MQYIAFIVLTWFMIKSASFSIYEIKYNKNKFGGTFCLVLSLLSFSFAITSLILFYGQSFIPSTFLL